MTYLYIQYFPKSLSLKQTVSKLCLQNNWQYFIYNPHFIEYGNFQRLHEAIHIVAAFNIFFFVSMEIIYKRKRSGRSEGWEEEKNKSNYRR